MNYPFIQQRIFETPLLLDPAKGAAVVAGLSNRLLDATVKLSEEYEDPITNQTLIRKAPYEIDNGVAVIKLIGTLVNRSDIAMEASGVLSYKRIGTQIDHALEDAAVHGIALEIDSFGGEVSGAFDLADRIRAAKSRKPVVAFVNDSALSAAYLLASQADKIVVSRTGSVGSIGVVMMHKNISQQLDDAGVVITLIHSGAHKTDMNPYEGIPSDVLARAQGELDAFRNMFAETVGLGRGNRFPASDAIATEAQVYRGADAVSLGLADEVSDITTAIKSFAASINKISAQTIDLKLETKKGTPKMEQVQDHVETKLDAGNTISRAHVAEMLEVGQIAQRLGVDCDVMAAIESGKTPDELRKTVLTTAARASDSSDIIAVKGEASSGQSSILSFAKSYVEKNNKL